MLAPAVQATLTWKSPLVPEPHVRERVVAEIRNLGWTLSQMEAALHDAHRAASHDHAFLLPRLELRLPLYDLGRRYRLVLTHLDASRIALLDEEGRKLADVTLH